MTQILKFVLVLKLTHWYYMVDIKLKTSYFKIGINNTKWLHRIEKIILNCLYKFKIFNFQSNHTQMLCTYLYVFIMYLRD